MNILIFSLIKKCLVIVNCLAMLGANCPPPPSPVYNRCFNRIEIEMKTGARISIPYYF